MGVPTDGADPWAVQWSLWPEGLLTLAQSVEDVLYQIRLGVANAC
jgi:hypothetical protein